MGFHAGSCCFWPSTAKPMVGVCDVAIAPTMRAMSTPRSGGVRGGRDAGTASLAAMIRMQIRRGANQPYASRPRAEPNGAIAPMTTTPDLAALLAPVLALVEEASAAIMAVYATGHDVEYKADDSPITRADRAAHEILS